MESRQATAVRSRDELACSALGFVVRVAREYGRHGVPLEDLVAEGNLGLLEAARRYDPGRETKFITYASWWIRKAILRAVHEQSRLVSIPSYQLRKGGPVARRAFEISLETPTGSEGSVPLREIMADERSPHPERRALEDEERRILREALDRLSTQEMAVVVRRFGLDGAPCQTLKEAGAELGVSRERVRQIERAATRKLRGAIRRRNAPPKPLRGARVTPA